MGVVGGRYGGWAISILLMKPLEGTLHCILHVRVCVEGRTSLATNYQHHAHQVLSSDTSEYSLPSFIGNCGMLITASAAMTLVPR
jgi:hypothetical protein